MNGKNLMMIVILGTGLLVCLAVFCKVCCCKTKIPEGLDDDEVDDAGYATQNMNSRPSEINVGANVSDSKAEAKKKLLEEVNLLLKTEKFDI